MSFSSFHRTLFKVKLLHLYSLNNGLSEFHSMNETEKGKQLDNYNFNTFFKILPTSDTQKRMNGQNIILKTTNTGISLSLKVTENNNATPFIALNDNLSLTFLIHLVDSRFYNYTDLKLDNANKIYYFSNRRLSTEPPSFPLIKKEGDINSVDETYVLTTDIVRDENWALIPDNKKFDPDSLSASEKDQLFGIIRIFMRTDDSSLNVIDALNQIPMPHTTFQIQFGNRKTFWRYIFRQHQTVNGTSDVEIEGSDSKVLITNTEKPLTEKGFISILLKGNELPNPNVNLLKPNPTSDKFYSEIYM